jgi:DNA-binding protein H-NS
MATLSDIQKQIAKLEKQAEVILKAAAAEAAKKARELIERHKLTAEDVGLAPKTAKAVKLKKTTAKAAPETPRPAGVPKYRDPKSGKTWTGNGKAPGWIAGAKNRDKFLISAPATPAVAELAPVAAPIEAVAAPKRAAKKVVAASKTTAPKAAAQKVAVPKAAEAPATVAPVKKAVTRKAAVKKAVAPAAAADAPATGAADAAPPAVAAA